MDWKVLRLIGCWLGVVVLLSAASPASAEGFAPGSICHASAAADEDYAQLLAHPERWNCSGSDWSVAKPRAFLRIDLRGYEGRPPAEFSTRLTRFGALRLTAIGTDGQSASRDLTQGDMIPSTTDWIMSADLPTLPGPKASSLTAVVVRVDGARHAGILSYGRLEPAAKPDAMFVQELLIAMLCGTLLLPLVFNVAFYRILRERFLLWHALATALMLVHTMITAGLINRFFSLGIDTLSIVSSITVGGGLIAAALFSADLIEPDKLDPIHRRLLRCVTLWVPPWTMLYLFADGPLRPYVAPLYLASFLPLIGLFGWVMAVALGRRSRAVRFQIAAWTPMMITALIRIFSALGMTDAPLEMLLEQHIAMGLEVVVTSLGALDRLMAIRRERDIAVAEARVLVESAERDPLTGLYNRRALERRFPDMRAGGFHAMALLDLDRFKRINDTFGHVKGDAVLRAVAEALAPDGDTLAARLGGEEFLILLRGDDVAHRAERRRQAITSRVAAQVPGLDCIVTASMGMVELPADGSLQNELAPLYARCDQLLYEAKAAGRNRTMREKVSSFAPVQRTQAA
ncbi:MAG: sensor domain-containing diguanylate cyclase [Novosphingobium sp.]